MSETNERDLCEHCGKTWSMHWGGTDACPTVPGEYSKRTRFTRPAPLPSGSTTTAEQQARDLLERLGVDEAQTYSSGDLVELANLLAERDAFRLAVEAFETVDYDGVRAMALRAPEDVEVERLCERVGYGAVMDAAARLWFLKDPNGAFTVGPCCGVARSAMQKLTARSLSETESR